MDLDGGGSMAVADEGGSAGSQQHAQQQQALLDEKRRQVEAELRRLDTLPAQSHYVVHRRQVARKALELLNKGDRRSQVGPWKRETEGGCGVGRRLGLTHRSLLAVICVGY